MVNSKIESLREKFMEELEKQDKCPEINTAVTETVFKLTEIIKNLDKIKMADKYADYDDEGESFRSYRGRMNRSYGHDHMMSKLYEAMSGASSEKEKRILHEAISDLENR